MKKLLLLSVAGLVAASCSTTEYYQDDLAVARRLDDDRQQQAQQAQQAQQTFDREGAIEQPTLAREDFERQREVKEMQAKLNEIDRGISDIEATMEDMPKAERERTASEVSDLRERQQRAERMLIDAETEEAPLAFNEARDELRDVINELEVAWYRLLVRDRAEPGPQETLD